MIIPIISMWQPWCFWVAKGWKTIESRTHQRFRSLAGKRIGIHSALKWDDTWMLASMPYLTLEQIAETKEFFRIGGAVICTVNVINHRPLTWVDSEKALIECGDNKRYGLILSDVQMIEAIPMKGRQGIWKADVAA